MAEGFIEKEMSGKHCNVAAHLHKITYKGIMYGAARGSKMRSRNSGSS